MHDFIELAANLKIQLRNMMVEDRLIQLLHFVPGFLQTLHKHFHRGSHARVGGGFRHDGRIIKTV